MNCQEFQQLADRVIDAGLDAAMMKKAKLHSSRCAACRSYLAARQEGHDALFNAVNEAYGAERAAADLASRLLASGARPARRKLRWPRWVAAAALLAICVALASPFAEEFFAPAEAAAPEETIDINTQEEQNMNIGKTLREGAAVALASATLAAAAPASGTTVIEGMGMKSWGAWTPNNAANGQIDKYHIPFTLEAWVKPESTESDVFNPIMCQWGGAPHWRMGLKNGKLIFETIRGDTTSLPLCESTSEIPVGEWTHVAVSFFGGADNYALRIYVNGKQDAFYDHYTFGKPSTRFLSLGGLYGRKNESAAGDVTFKGRLADLRVWRCARTAQEVADNMYQRLSGAESNLVNYFRLDDNTATKQLFDSCTASHSWLGPALEFVADADFPALAEPAEKAEYALFFRRNDSCIRAVFPERSLPLSNDFTVELWIKPDVEPELAARNKIALFGLYSPVGSTAYLDGRIGVALNDKNHIILFKNNGSGQTISDVDCGPLVNGARQWTHLALTHSAEAINIYTNGVLLYSATPAGGNLPVPTGAALALGNNNTASSGATYVGGMCDLRVWNEIRTPEEIAQDMAVAPNLDDEELLGYWPLRNEAFYVGGPRRGWEPRRSRRTPTRPPGSGRAPMWTCP